MILTDRAGVGPLIALANVIDPDMAAMVADVFTPAYMVELGQRYPSVARTGAMSESVVDLEIARCRAELAS